ncbi:MAG TPA: FeoB-associated Cys-rich membrane protein [Opitutae bacterium]|nr:FeoB-associated Cys-rich membrane protein [Opitutae bacterium]
MKTVEIILVALIVLGAVLYLYKTFKPKKKTGCGCGTVDCKVPKPTIERASNDN